MKGLLIKDFYTLTKQLKIFLVIIVLFTFMQGSSAYSFAILYSAMLPITALAYDERSKWDKLAAMMPYSTSTLVLGKYLLGYICVAAAAILSIIIKVVLSLYTKKPFPIEIFVEMLPVVCFASMLQAFNLPFMFKMGVEKGRLIFLAFIAIIVFGGTAFKDEAAQWLVSQQADFMSLAVVVLLLTMIINVISIALSIRIYKHKEN